MATTGSRPDEDAEGLAEPNRYRASHDLPAEVRHVSPSARELAEAWPDLRGEMIRTAEVTGVAVRRRTPAEAGPWPEQTA